MLPTLRAGQIVLFMKTKSPEAGFVVLSTIDGRDVVKRLHKNAHVYSLRGDNPTASTDYDDIDMNSVRAKLIYPQV